MLPEGFLTESGENPEFCINPDKRGFICLRELVKKSKKMSARKTRRINHSRRTNPNFKRQMSCIFFSLNGACYQYILLNMNSSIANCASELKCSKKCSWSAARKCNKSKCKCLFWVCVVVQRCHFYLRSGTKPKQGFWFIQYFLQTTFRGFLSTLAEVVQAEARASFWTEAEAGSCWWNSGYNIFLLGFTFISVPNLHLVLTFTKLRIYVSSRYYSLFTCRVLSRANGPPGARGPN